MQARKKWNTRHASGTRNVSAVASVRRQLERNRSFLANKIFIVLDVMKTNLQLAVSSAQRCVCVWYSINSWNMIYILFCVFFKQVITTGGVTYKNDPWHRECFTCTHCETPLAGQRFTSRDEKPYCADCFGELFAKRCTACTKPITGKTR